ncbi:hypothetical protein C8D77_1011390 [Mesorhizobium loti]|uniref:Uncharacterized protein n=1 Tax=Rhizobium loti TaxID=381 RepID=A0A8E2WKJ8_RHILI|nr:hypothetical protein [Mesorhizobium sp. M7D.F.Ca.US.005.01.1.1]PWJ94704.1 hypothetical protein C8D77_1011390 [Mesorhizobium loti]
MNAVDAPRQTGVSIQPIDGQWAVRIVENGETIQRLFEEEQFARNFAAG